MEDPIISYAKACVAHEKGDDKEAVELLKVAIGSQQENNAIEANLDKLLNGDTTIGQLALQLVKTNTNRK